MTTPTNISDTYTLRNADGGADDGVDLAKGKELSHLYRRLARAPQTWECQRFAIKNDRTEHLTFGTQPELLAIIREVMDLRVNQAKDAQQRAKQKFDAAQEVAIAARLELNAANEQVNWAIWQADVKSEF